MSRNAVYILKGFVGFLLLLSSYALYGQTTIEGVIADKSGAPINGVNVVLSPKGKETVLAYALSDEKGYYLLNYTGTIDSLDVTLTSFDYAKTVRRIANRSQTVNFSLAGAPIRLNEVRVKAEPISQKGDTLSYLVSAFAGKEDRVIADVLKKMPGIEVSPSGEISYNGETINKFYIEDLDLLQGRYGIATKNISVQDVASVQVYEQHQPVKALSKSTPSDKAAINIKLKDNVKGTWSAIAQLGAGAAPLLWENELVSLYFAKKLQNINTYKGNNTGNDVAQELTAFYSDAYNPLATGKFLSIVAPSPPSIKTNRYLFNNINTGSSNLLFVLPKEYQLTTNINYVNDLQHSNSFSHSAYYVAGDSTLVIDESLAARQQKNNLNAVFKLTTNRETFYLTNTLSLNGAWNDGVSQITDTINQQLNTTNYTIFNAFELIKSTSGGKQYRIYSFNGFEHTPQNLHVQPNLYDNIFNHDAVSNKLRQTTSFNNFQSNTIISFLVSKYQFRQTYYAGIDMTAQSLNSLLAPLYDHQFVAAAPDSMQNELNWGKYTVYVNSQYSYSWRRFRIEAVLPLSYNLLFIHDKLPQEKQAVNRILFNPLLSVHYDLNRYWSFRAYYRFFQNLGSIRDSYTGYIMQNYRNFIKYDGVLADTKTSTYSLHTAYRNPLSALFAHVDLVYEQFSSNLLRELSYAGILQVQNTVHRPAITKTYGGGGSISKGLYALNSTVSLSASYYSMSSSQINQGALIDYTYRNYGIKPAIETQLSSWGGFSFTLLWSESENMIEHAAGNLPIRSLSDYLSINIFPTKNLSIMLGGEHYYTNAVSEKKNKLFADMSVRYKFSRIDVAVKWSNIFNTQDYITAMYSATSELLHIYEIRPSQVLLTAKFKLW